jgi:hypothetical protein
VPKNLTADHGTYGANLGHAVDTYADHEEEFQQPIMKRSSNSALLHGMQNWPITPHPKPKTDIHDVQTPPPRTPTVRRIMAAFGAVKVFLWISST